MGTDTKRDESNGRTTLRPGQVVFNEIASLDPNFAESVRGTKLDPFYRDDRIGEMLAAWRESLRSVEARAEASSQPEQETLALAAAYAALRQCAVRCDICGRIATRERAHHGTGRICDREECAQGFDGAVAVWFGLPHAAALRAAGGAR